MKKNPLEKIRAERKLTYEQLGELAGYRRETAWKHCKGVSVPADAAIKYSASLGVFFSDLRPDLPIPVCAPLPEASHDR